MERKDRTCHIPHRIKWYVSGSNVITTRSICGVYDVVYSYKFGVSLDA